MCCIRCHRNKPTQGQCGTMAFFVSAIILPLLFVLFALSLDFSRYFLEGSRRQQLLDDTGLYAARFLPQAAAAHEAATAFLQNQLSDLEHISIETSSDFVVLESRYDFPLLFASWFKPGAGLPLYRRTRVRARPFDALIAMDAGAYLAPTLNGAAWSEINWPPATYFSHLQRFDYQSGGTQIVPPVLLSQQCFNPALSALKEAALALYNYLTTAELNAVGLGVFPSGSLVLDNDGQAQPVGSSRLAMLRKVSPRSQLAVNFEQYQRMPLSSWDCAAAAETEQYHLQYRFPTAATDRRLWVQTVAELRNSNFLSNLTVAEALWSRPAAATVISFPDLLQDLSTQLLSTPVLTQRQGLVAGAYTSAFILTGDIPWIAGQRWSRTDPSHHQILQSACYDYRRRAESRGLNHKLYYVLMRHEHYPLLRTAEIHEISQLFADCSRSEGSAADFSIQLVTADNTAALHQEVLKSLVLDRRRTLISW